jgi:hypothetical protein
MAVAATIYLKDSSLVPEPVVGATVSVYTTDGEQVAQVTTTEEGAAELLLPGGIYEVRAYCRGYLFDNPYGIDVREPPDFGETNEFDLSCTSLSLPIPFDPRVCRCTGRLVNLSNQPYTNALVRISAKAEPARQTPKIVDGRLVAAEAVALRTDSNGSLTVDLIRGGSYYVAFAGEDDCTYEIIVPDRPSANLVDLMFPVPAALVWDEEAAPGRSVTLRVGETRSIPVGAIFTNFHTYTDSLHGLIEFTNTNAAASKALFASREAAMTVTGLAPGVSEFYATILPDKFPDRVPAVGEIGPRLTVTVIE